MNKEITIGTQLFFKDIDAEELEYLQNEYNEDCKYFDIPSETLSLEKIYEDIEDTFDNFSTFINITLDTLSTSGARCIYANDYITNHGNLYKLLYKMKDFSNQCEVYVNDNDIIIEYSAIEDHRNYISFGKNYGFHTLEKVIFYIDNKKEIRNFILKNINSVIYERV